ncbi:MAG: VOC family protein [Candidatus Hatepunaea meridiana]|nr:VOC family protein [Candidatus Hatepunaea meridiana]
MGNPVIFFEIAGRDAKKLSDFYSRLFGWNISYDKNEAYATINTDADNEVNGGINECEGEVPPYVTFYIQVDDLKEHINLIEQSGGKIMVPPITLPNGGSYAMFLDPEGNVIGLMQS